MPTTLLITGATRGLGLATASAAAARGGDTTILVAGRAREDVERVSGELGATPVILDLASMESTRSVIAELPRIDALATNAGLQIPGARSVTGDGLERTVQVNHLAHLALIDALIAKAQAPMRIALVGSGTHDPAARTGVPAPEGLPAEALIAGDGDDSTTSGRRRYSTSKLLITAAALGLARENPDHWVGCFDPGLMPGTGLARDYTGLQRALWSTVMRALTVMPFASTPARSGRMLASLLLDDPPPQPSGTVVNHRMRPGILSARAADPAFQDEVLRASREATASAG